MPDRARSSTSRKLGALGISILLAAALAAHLAWARSQPKRPDPKEWVEGPVRYLATPDENRVFRALETDAERSAFIDAFWRRRDPTPETDDNEYRRLFHARVREANQNFTETAAPGWKTDRGRIHILCGPPTRIEDEPYADVTDSSPTAGRGLLRWIYEGRACGRSDMGAAVIVPFVRSVSGAYRLSYDPRFSSIAFNPYQLTDPARVALDRWLSVVAPAERSALGVMMDLGKLQETPHPEEVLLDRVETIETYGSHALAVELHRFEHPRGGTLLVITVRFPGAPSAGTPSLMARLTPRDAARPRRFLTEESFRFETADGERLAQARVVLDRGTWDLTVLSAEPGTTTSGVFRSAVEALAPGAGLRRSDVVVARRLEPLAYASLSSYDEPFLIGRFRVLPRAGLPLRRQDTLILFFELYGGTGPFRTSFQLEGKEEDGRFTKLGSAVPQEQPDPAHGWSIPIGPQWPQGEYRVQIVAQDSSDQSLSATVPFVVEP